MAIINTTKVTLKKMLNQIYPYVNHHYFKKILKKNEHALIKQNLLKRGLDGERILVLAPHSDDETIGCGGALLQYAKNNKSITVVFLTNSGKRGSVNPGDNIENVRREEALKAANLIGIPQNRVFFLSGEDGNLKNSFDLAELDRIIKVAAPDTVLLPAPIDTHQDHRAVSKILLNWSKEFPLHSKKMEESAQIYLYDVQSPLTQFYSNITLDISLELAEKKNIITVFQSQENVKNFATLLDSYYGLLFGLLASEVYLNVPFSKFISVTAQYIDQFEDLSHSLVKAQDERTLIKSYKSSIKLKSILLKYHTHNDFN